VASRYWTQFSQRDTAAGPPPSARQGVAPRSGKTSGTEKAWPKPGPMKQVGFNRKTKVPVVKAYAAKGGLA
jgi:hypothetical protein